MMGVLPPGRAIGSLFAGNVLLGAGLFFHAFLYNFYLDAVGHPETVMGYAAASLTAGGLASLLPAGKVVDTLGARVVLCAAVVIGAGGLALGALATHPGMIYGAAVAAGAGAGSWRVAQGPMIMRLTDSNTRPRVFSWNVGLLVGTGGVWILISGSVPAWLEVAFGLTPLASIRVALLAGAAASLLAFGFFAMLPPVRPLAADPGETASPASSMNKPKPSRVPGAVIILVVLVAGWMLAPALVTPFFNIFFQREFGVPVARIGVIFAAAHLVTAFAIFGSAELATRLGPKRALAGWMMLFGPAMLVLAVVHSLPIAIVLYLVQGFVSPATNPLIDQILLEMAPPERQGAVASWRNAATEGSGAGGAAVGGLLLQGGSFAVLFGIAGVVGLIAATMLLLGLFARRGGSRILT